jgi:hypothetical protein
VPERFGFISFNPQKNLMRCYHFCSQMTNRKLRFRGSCLDLFRSQTREGFCHSIPDSSRYGGRRLIRDTLKT